MLYTEIKTKVDCYCYNIHKAVLQVVSYKLYFYYFSPILVHLFSLIMIYNTVLLVYIALDRPTDLSRCHPCYINEYYMYTLIYRLVYGCSTDVYFTTNQKIYIPNLTFARFKTPIYGIISIKLATDLFRSILEPIFN